MLLINFTILYEDDNVVSITSLADNVLKFINGEPYCTIAKEYDLNQINVSTYF